MTDSLLLRGRTCTGLNSVINTVWMNLSSKLPAVRNKYKTGKFMKVADLAELKGERIIDLAGNK